MAAILQLRRGVITDFSDYGTNLSEPYFDTDRDTIHIGTTEGTSSNADFITLVKLSQANRDFTKDEPNTGSIWLTSGSDGTSGNYTGSNMILYNNIIVSGSGFIEGDLHLEGHLFLGSGSDDDVVRVQSEFSGSLIPDNDITGSTAFDATIAYYDIGSNNKRYRNVYLQKDVNSGSLGGALSGSNIDLTGQIKVDELGRFGYVEVDDLVDNRLVIVGPSGRLEDDANLTYDGQDFRLTNSDFYQSGSGASFQFVGAGGEVTGSWTVSELAIDNGIVFTNAEGTLDNQNEFTWDGGTLYVDGNISGSGTLEIDGQSTLASLKVEDLTNDRILIAGVGGEVEDDQYFRYTGNDFIIGAAEHFKVNRTSGNTFISGAVQMYSTLNVDDQTTVASLNVEDLTDNRVVIVGAGGEIEDDGNFTFNGTELNIGTGNFTVQQGSGNTQIVGTLNVDSQSTLASANVEDLTSGRVVLAGTDGEIEDSENLTFDGSLLTVTGDTIITGDLTVQGDTTTLNVGELVVEDKNILIASGALNASAANGAGITIDGAGATLTYESTNNWFTFDRDTQVQGDLYVTNEISSSTVNGIGNVEIYSASVDSRLDDTEWTGSNHETRVINLELTGSDHEQRIDSIESISGSLLYSASNDFSQIQLNKIDGTTLELDVTPRRVTESVINKNGFMSKGTPVYVSGSTGNALHVFAASASRVDRMPATFVLDQDLNTDEEGYGILSGFINGVDTSLFEEGDSVYVGENGGYTNQRPSGSNILVQKLGNVVKKAINGSGVITGAGRANDVPNIQQGHLWVGNSDDVATQYTTSSLIPQGTVSGSDQLTGSLASTGSNEFNGNQTITGSVNITNVLNLESNDPLPIGTIGDLAVSGSNLYFYNGSWTQIV